MGFSAAVALVGLIFGMISIKLMSIIENAQVVMTGAIGNNSKMSRNKKRIIASVMGTRKIIAIKMGVIFFGRISSLIFAVEAMYPEKAVERATLVIMNTVLVSNKIGRVAAKHGRSAARRMRTTSLSYGKKHKA
jgi:hypothetical protein